MRISILALALLAACAGRRPTADTPVLDVSQLGPEQPESDDLILRFPEGTRLPVRIDVVAPFVRSEGGPATTLVFERTVYWYVGNPRLISFDGKTWRPITEGHRGQLDLGVGASAGKSTVATVRVTLSDR